MPEPDPVWYDKNRIKQDYHKNRRRNMLLAAENICKSYTVKPLLSNITLYISEGDKIGVIGVNGTGKSTFLKILADREEADSGKMTKNPNLRIEYLAQNPICQDEKTIMEQVFFGVSPEVVESKIIRSENDSDETGDHRI